MVNTNANTRLERMRRFVLFFIFYCFNFYPLVPPDELMTTQMIARARC